MTHHRRELKPLWQMCVAPLLSSPLATQTVRVFHALIDVKQLHQCQLDGSMSSLIGRVCLTFKRIVQTPPTTRRRVNDGRGLQMVAWKHASSLLIIANSLILHTTVKLSQYSTDSAVATPPYTLSCSAHCIITPVQFFRLLFPRLADRFGSDRSHCPSRAWR